jgi:hypothetical protein
MGRQFIPEPHHQGAEEFIGVVDAVERRQFTAPQAGNHGHGFHVRIGTGDSPQQPGSHLMVAERTCVFGQQGADDPSAGQSGCRFRHCDVLKVFTIPLCLHRPGFVGPEAMLFSRRSGAAAGERGTSRYDGAPSRSSA